ncbi:MAG: DNA circularization N-terminal domain-containing protein, partial [Elusimicrobia bacterium]|nr:DNA circularization N-terminal domain-containing protein [Elusimicrobiota bacterium]
MAFPELPDVGALLGLTSTKPEGGSTRKVTDGTFKGYTFHIAKPTKAKPHGISSEESHTGRRLQMIERALVDGGPVRDWGRKHIVHTVNVVFIGPHYHREFEAFEKILNEGTAGILVLPNCRRALVAFFQDMDSSVAVEDGESKRVRVTWVEHREGGKQIATGTAAAPTIDDSKGVLDSDVDKAKSFLQDNPLINGIKFLESGLSQVRSATNAVLTLEQGVRNRIKQLAANINGTLDLIKSATKEIKSLFGKDKKFAREVNAAATSVKKRLGLDRETGQVLADFNEPDTVTPPVDPLVKPETESDVEISADNLTSPAAVQVFADQVIAQLEADLTELAEASDGRTDDVTMGVTAALNSFENFIAAVVTIERKTVIVPDDMSLGEVLFH